VRSVASAGATQVVTLSGQEQPNEFICTIRTADAPDSESKMVKALKWLLEDARRDNNREVA
jgi:hypothetical protein